MYNFSAHTSFRTGFIKKKGLFLVFFSFRIIWQYRRF